MRIAVVHDWLNGMRGGEKVLEEILRLFPDSTVYTLFHERGKVSPFIESHRIVTSWLDRVPGIYRYYRNLLPLFPVAAKSWNVDGFDIVISSSHAVAKSVRCGVTPHVCYCHTPMRYVWDAEDDYGASRIRQAGLRLIQSQLQQWDCKAARSVSYFVANSNFVRERIRLYYGRDAAVIHPPVDTAFFSPAPFTRQTFYLAAGALVPYKRFDLIIDAFNRLGRKLVIAGAGPESSRLKKLAGRNVEFRGRVSNEELRHLYRTARAAVFAAREDFGMMAVEAEACGCPVIALGAGGAAETVQHGINGILFSEQAADDLAGAVGSFEALTWPVDRVRFKVECFSREVFRRRFKEFIVTRANSAKPRELETLPA
jgi:glycosyltransferase involved in cell wall biosynthesis